MARAGTTGKVGQVRGSVDGLRAVDAGSERGQEDHGRDQAAGHHGPLGRPPGVGAVLGAADPTAAQGQAETAQDGPGEKGGQSEGRRSRGRVEEAVGADAEADMPPIMSAPVARRDRGEAPPVRP